MTKIKIDKEFQKKHDETDTVWVFAITVAMGIGFLLGYLTGAY